MPRAAVAALVALVERDFDEERGRRMRMTPVALTGRRRLAGLRRRARGRRCGAAGARVAPRRRPGARKRRPCATAIAAALRIARPAGRRQPTGRRPTSSASRSRCSRTTTLDRAGLRGDRRRRSRRRGLARGARRRDRRLRGAPTTTISAPAPPISRTSATACSRTLAGADAAADRRPALVSREDLTPSRFLATDWTPGGGIVLAARQPDEPCRHARARRAACRWWSALGAARPATAQPRRIVDGDERRVVLGPEQRAARLRRAPRRARRGRGGARRIAAVAEAGASPPTARRSPCMINVADPAELDALDPATCDGIGLVRTEFLFTGGALPDEETQFASIAASPNGRRPAGHHPHARCRRRQADRRA